MIAKGKPKPREPQSDSAAEPQQPFIDFGDATKIMLDTPPLKNPVDKSSFTVHKGALADSPEQPLVEAQGPVAQPFVKWVGGKRSLMNSIRQYLPAGFDNYYECFVGGGAVFFALVEQITKAYLSDNNLDLVITYQEIKQDPTRLIARLKELAAGHSEEQYYRVRDEEPADEVEVAARFVYLNKTCFNGLWRVNKSGKFNVPMGDYKNPNIVNEENLLACHKALQKATITFHDYRKVDPRPQAGDFVYLDSPYHPTADDSFTAYTRENFTEQNQVELRDFALELHQAGVRVMLSNSKTRFIEDLYSDRAFHLHIVQAPRTVNCKPNARGAVDEYLITNY
ncbi:MAG TPA: DNA adenine methylase [Pyrinomonadaceae bacterium]|jgi:DNA adenine methylase